MDISLILAFLILGTVVGFAAGLLGIGGGMLMVPFITLLLTAKKLSARVDPPHGDCDIACDYLVYLNLIGACASQTRRRVVAYRKAACAWHSDWLMDRPVARQANEFICTGDVFRRFCRIVGNTNAAG